MDWFDNHGVRPQVGAIPSSYIGLRQNEGLTAASELPTVGVTNMAIDNVPAFPEHSTLSVVQATLWPAFEPGETE